jgi:endonuclease-3
MPVKPAIEKPKKLSKSEQAKRISTRLPQFLDAVEPLYINHPLDDICEGNAFRVLVGCIISLRTKDEVTIPACERLFPKYDTPADFLKLSVEQVEQLIYPAGFYKTKARTILEACQVLIDQYDGQVPDTIEELMKLKGVGRKTANLVVGLGHRLPAICVDIHVHRICNRLGVLQTATPDETEFALRYHLPPAYWAKINKLMVLYGRDICRPIGAWCDVCTVTRFCDQVAVKNRKPPTAKR